MEFDKRVEELAQLNNSDDLREEIDAVVGCDDPSWENTNYTSGYFNHEELALILIALGGPYNEMHQE